MSWKYCKSKTHLTHLIHWVGFSGCASGKESFCQCRRCGFDSWVGKIPWSRKYQYSCLENPMDRGAWQATVHGVTKSQTQLKQLSTASILAWKIPWTEEPSRLQFMGYQRVKYGWATEHTHMIHWTSQFSWTHLRHAQNTHISLQLGKNNWTQSLFLIKYWIDHVMYWIPYWKCNTEWLYGYRMVVSVLAVSLYQCDCGPTGSCVCCHCPASSESVDGISLAWEKTKIWSMFFTECVSLLHHCKVKKL